VVRRQRSSDAWFDAECRDAKRLTRRLERSYAAAVRRSPQQLPNSPVSATRIDDAKTVWYAQRRSYRDLLQLKRRAHWVVVVETNRNSPKRLWSTVDHLLGRGRLPVNPAVTAEDLSHYFEEKVAAVQAATADATPPVYSFRVQLGMEFTCFKPVSTEEVVVAVRRLPDISSAVDPLPVNLLKQVVTELAPYLTELFNRSLAMGYFPGTYKAAYITPLLKKQSLDAADVKSYRPISNLSVLSKLLERLVAKQLIDYLKSAQLFPLYQSACRSNHSTETETAVLHVLSEIFTAADRGDLSALVLLDLSAAFDTVDHDVLLKRLDISYGVAGCALKWFQSYLCGRTQHVRLGLNKSSIVRLLRGVPQGCVLGPILFVLYTADLVHVIEEYGLHGHLFADDTQVIGLCHDVKLHPHFHCLW